MDQTKLRLATFLPYRLSIASNAVSARIANAYEAMFGLKIPEWRLIAVLAEESNLTQADIVARTEMDKMTVSRAAAALVSRRIAARAANADDKRSHRLALTPAGRRLYDQVVPEALRLEAIVFRDFTPAEIDQLHHMLGRMEAAARNSA